MTLACRLRLDSSGPYNKRKNRSGEIEVILPEKNEDGGVRRIAFPVLLYGDRCLVDTIRGTKRVYERKEGKLVLKEEEALDNNESPFNILVGIHTLVRAIQDKYTELLSKFSSPPIGGIVEVPVSKKHIKRTHTYKEVHLESLPEEMPHPDTTPKRS